MLADYYFYGLGVDKNYYETVKWARKGADAGNSVSEFYLGLCYLIGKGVSKDEGQAFQWLYKAGNNSNPYKEAYFYIGNCYDHGEGVSKNPYEARRWYEKYISYCEKENMTDDILYSMAKGSLKLINEKYPQQSTSQQQQVPVQQQNQPGSFFGNTQRQQTQQQTQTQRHPWQPPVFHSNYSSSTLEPLGYEWQDIDGANGAQDYRWLGITVGYAQTQFTQKFDDGRKETFGYFSETSHLDGIRVGVSVEPQLPLGFGVYMGLFYEYFFSNKKNVSMGYRSGRGITNMHCLYVPIHAEWRANFSSQFQLFVHGGLGLDYCAGANASLTDGNEELWSASGKDFFEGIKDYNFSAEGAVGLRWQAFQLDFTMAKGLLNMTENTNVKTYQNKNMAVSLSYFF